MKKYRTHDQLIIEEIEKDPKFFLKGIFEDYLEEDTDVLIHHPEEGEPFKREYHSNKENATIALLELVTECTFHQLDTLIKESDLNEEAKQKLLAKIPIKGQFLNNPDETLFSLKEGERTSCCDQARCGHTPTSFQENALIPAKHVSTTLIDGEEGKRPYDEYYTIHIEGEPDRYLVVHYTELYASSDWCEFIEKIPDAIPSRFYQ
jgi:hypothetical protein